MLIRMFDREITQQELTDAAAARGIETLPVLHNPKEQPVMNPAAVDENSLAALAGNLAASAHRLHVIYQLISVSVPMLSLYMDLEQADVLSYNRNGIRVSRMINPQDLKRLLLEAFTALPMIPSADDTCCALTFSGTTADLVRRIYAGETDGLDIPSDAGFTLAEITDALRENPCIRCAFEDENAKPVSYYGISDGSRLFCIYPAENGVNISCGSARPVIDAVSRGWMARCRAAIAAEKPAAIDFQPIK